MKKRILALLVAMSMMTSLAACGAIDDEKYDEFIPLISTDSDSNTDSQTTTDSASGDDSSVPEQTEDPAVTTTANSEEPSSSDTNATDNSSLTNSQSETTTTTTQGENSGSVTTTPASGSSTTTTTTTKKPTSSTTTTTTKKPTSSTTTTTTKKPTSSTTTTTTAHKHSYTSKITKNATCLVAGEKTYTCSCGHSYTEGISATGHSYTTKIVSPTPEAQGYTLHTCSRCSDSYKDDYTAKITLSAPSGFAKSGTPITSAMFTWRKVSNADGYVIEMSTDSQFSSYDTYTVSGASTLTYTVSSLTPAKLYHFRIKSYKTIDGKKYYSSPSASVFFYTQLAKPNLYYNQEESKEATVRLRWKSVTGASTYTIEKYNTVYSKWEVVKTVDSSETYCDVTALSPVCEYRFRIKAKDKTGAAYSVYSDELKAKTSIPFTSFSGDPVVTSSTIKLSWYRSSVATAYEIGVLNSKGEWDVVDTISAGSSNVCEYTIKSLKSKTTYTVGVRIINGSGSNKYFSKWKDDQATTK